MSQQAKDVATFLAWTSEPYHDTRKILALKVRRASDLYSRSHRSRADRGYARTADDFRSVLEEIHVVVPEVDEVLVAYRQGSRTAVDDQVILEERYRRQRRDI